MKSTHFAVSGILYSMATPCILRDAVTHEDVVHVLHRVLPGLDLALGRGVAQASLEGGENLAFDDVRENVFGKLIPCGRVDNHCFVCNRRFLGLESDQDANEVNLHGHPDRCRNLPTGYSTATPSIRQNAASATIRIPY